MVKLIGAFPHAGGSPEVVDGHGVDARLGKPAGHVLVEAVQTADVGKDHQAGSARLGGSRRPCGEPVAVGGGQDQVIRSSDLPMEAMVRRSGVGAVTHGMKS